LVFGVWCLLFSGCWLRFSGFKLFGVWCLLFLVAGFLVNLFRVAQGRGFRCASTSCGLRVEIGFCLVLLYQFADHEQRA